jgi:hypothetical protein
MIETVLFYAWNYQGIRWSLRHNNKSRLDVQLAATGRPRSLFVYGQPTISRSSSSCPARTAGAVIVFNIHRKRMPIYRTTKLFAPDHHRTNQTTALASQYKQLIEYSSLTRENTCL